MMVLIIKLPRYFRNFTFNKNKGDKTYEKQSDPT